MVKVLTACFIMQKRESLPCVAGGQTDDEIHVVRLDGGFVGGAIADDGAATFTAMNENVAAAGIGFCPYGAEQAATGVGAVAGENIHVHRPQAKGTVIAGGVTEREYLPSAMAADKAAVIFLKTLGLHG